MLRFHHWEPALPGWSLLCCGFLSSRRDESSRTTCEANGVDKPLTFCGFAGIERIRAMARTIDESYRRAFRDALDRPHAASRWNARNRPPAPRCRPAVAVCRGTCSRHRAMADGWTDSEPHQRSPDFHRWRGELFRGAVV